MMPDLLQISHPRRILVLGPPKSGKLTFLRALTGTLPSIHPPELSEEPRDKDENDKTPHAGISHSYKIRTNYYEAEIPIWVDEWEGIEGGLKSWTEQYLSPEAKEVIQALGGVAVCFRQPATKDGIESITSTLSSVQRILEKHIYAFDGVCLAVCTPRNGALDHLTSASSHQIGPPSPNELSMSPDDWEGLIRQFGFEFIDFSSIGRNEYGESTGMDRVKEALESNDWSFDDPYASFEDVEDEDGDEEDVKGGKGFKTEVAELEKEMLGLSRELNAMTVEGEGEGEERNIQEEKEVEELESLVLRMAVLRELGEDENSKIERRRLAAQFLSSIMREDEDLSSSNNSRENNK